MGPDVVEEIKRDIKKTINAQRYKKYWSRSPKRTELTIGSRIHMQRRRSVNLLLNANDGQWPKSLKGLSAFVWNWEDALLR